MRLACRHAGDGLQADQDGRTEVAHLEGIYAVGPGGPRREVQRRTTRGGSPSRRLSFPYPTFDKNSLNDWALLRTLECGYGGLSFSPTLQLISSANHTVDRLHICSLRDGKKVKELIVLPNKRYDLGSDTKTAFSPSGSVLVSAAFGAWRDKGWETTLRLWRANVTQ